MKRRIAAALAATSLSIALAAPVAAAPTAAHRQLDPSVSKKLDKAITDVMRRAGVPGVTVGLWIPGKGRYVRSFGVADKRTHARMSPRLNIRIGSETKTFTITGLLRLVDQGKVKLDDPISRYVSGVPGGTKITLRQLAEMRSGLFSYSEDPGFDKALMSNPRKPWTPRQLLSYAFKHPAKFKPGAKFDYSNTNTILLGLAIEKVSGQSLRDFLRHEVFEPAHLKHTVFPKGAEFPAPHAHGYTNQTLNGKTADATNWDPSWGWAAGAIISDLNDLHAWARTLATGSLLSAKTQAQRLRFLPTGFPGTGYGLGIFDNHGWIGHNGSLPGYQAAVVYLPQTKASLVVLSNTDTSSQGYEPSTLFAQAITRIVTPGHIYSLPKAP
jgi:D-alanyl-D-alanine carboxypeptidase